MNEQKKLNLFSALRKLLLKYDILFIFSHSTTFQHPPTVHHKKQFKYIVIFMLKLEVIQSPFEKRTHP